MSKQADGSDVVIPAFECAQMAHMLGAQLTGVDPDDVVIAKLQEACLRAQADARVLWAVRVLDKWEGDQRGWGKRLIISGHESGQRTLTLSCSPKLLRTFRGDHPDTARIAAAEALVAEDPTLDR